jgi:glucose-6-phosphate isomerase
MPTYKNLDATQAYPTLDATRPFDVTELDTQRIRSLQIPLAADLTYSYAATPVDGTIIGHLGDLAVEQELQAKYAALAAGEIMNTGEQRRVLHHLLRGQLGPAVVDEDGTDLGAFYREQQRRFSDFAVAVHEKKVLGYTGLFVLVSKSGTTQETLTNEQFLRDQAAKRAPHVDISRHTVAVTSQTSPLATGDVYRDSFFIDDFIGGRYSATSAVGGVVLSLAFGPAVFEQVLAGAHTADKAAMNADITANATLLDAMIGVYERNVLGMPTTAVLPYSQALSRFPAHLQQLDMESNGKSVNRDGEPVAYSTGPIVFGEPGTNGQHSFYQLLHQGTDPIPLQFIGFHESQIGTDTHYEGTTSQTKLNANLAAQIVAFAMGKRDANPNKSFVGGRPSSLIFGKRLTPEALGALLAHYENKVMFQGFVWNINSFDQEGVQLGKILTKTLLSGKPSAQLSAYAELLQVT